MNFWGKSIMKQISVKANGSLLHEAIGYKYETLFCILKTYSVNRLLQNGHALFLINSL